MSAPCLPIRCDAEVVANRAESGPNRRLRLRLSAWPGSAPGQFVMLSPGARAAVERQDPLLPRPMAVYRSQSAGAETEIEILFKASGRGTALLAAARPGERVGVVGPLGRGFPDPPPGRPAFLVGGGTGIASLHDLAQRAASRTRTRVFLGARTASDLMGDADFEALGVELRITTEDGTRGRRGRVTELLEEALAGSPDASVFACGPTPMMRRAADLAAGVGSPCFVSLENPMACGFGVCLGCAAPRTAGGFALVCRDGPVFEAAEIDWERLA